MPETQQRLEPRPVHYKYLPALLEVLGVEVDLIQTGLPFSVNALITHEQSQKVRAANGDFWHNNKMALDKDRRLFDENEVQARRAEEAARERQAFLKFVAELAEKPELELWRLLCGNNELCGRVVSALHPDSAAFVTERDCPATKLATSILADDPQAAAVRAADSVLTEAAKLFLEHTATRQLLDRLGAAEDPLVMEQLLDCDDDAELLAKALYASHRFPDDESALNRCASLVLGCAQAEDQLPTLFDMAALFRRRQRS